MRLEDDKSLGLILLWQQWGYEEEMANAASAAVAIKYNCLGRYTAIIKELFHMIYWRKDSLHIMREVPILQQQQNTSWRCDKKYLTSAFISSFGGVAISIDVDPKEGTASSIDAITGFTDRPLINWCVSCFGVSEHVNVKHEEVSQSPASHPDFLSFAGYARGKVIACKRS